MANRTKPGPTTGQVTGPITGQATGMPLRRREDARLVTGGGRYVDDVRLDGALHVAFVRSMNARGRIISIEAEAARTQAGVAAVFTGEDVRGLGDLAVNQVLETVHLAEFPVLASGSVNAVGQPVAAVVACSAQAAADAADHVYVEIEDRAGSTSLEPNVEDGLFDGVPENVAMSQSWSSGEAGPAFASADHVVEVEIEHPRLAPAPMETRAIAADLDADSGVLTVWLSTQTPHRARKELARILGIDEAGLRLIAPDVGGAFGMKASLYPEEVFVAWAALKLKQPVRWTATRGEDLLSATHGRGARTRGRLAVTDAGAFLALRAEIATPLGHWLPTSAAIPAWNAARILPGPYKIDNVEISTRAVMTNTAPVGIYRGAGRPEAAALMERLVDKAARATGLDPAEIRTRNLLPPDAMPHEGATGIVLDSGDYRLALEKLCAFADYASLKREKQQRLDAGETVGLGFCIYVEPCGQGWESARVDLRADGSIVAATGSSTQGHGRETAYAQILADVFGVDPGEVTVMSGDTGTCPDGIGAVASRSTAIGGSALLKAARDVKEQAAADGPTPEGLSATAVYEAEGEAWGYGCYLAMVSIDKETGAVTAEKMYCLDDPGMIVNPMLVKGQIVGGIAQGLGEALLERIVYDEDAQLVTGSLTDYALPRADDMPEISITTMSTPSPFNLLGAKGVGEAGAIGAPAAILNAVHDALAPLGVGDIAMPLTSERVWRAINAARQEASAK